MEKHIFIVSDKEVNVRHEVVKDPPPPRWDWRRELSIIGITVLVYRMLELLAQL